MISLFRLSNPVRLRKTLSFEEIEDHRADFCFFYDSCLVYAGSLRWTSFSCAHCRIFLEEQRTGFMKNHPELCSNYLTEMQNQGNVHF